MATISWLTRRADFTSIYHSKSLYEKWGNKLTMNDMSGISVKLEGLDCTVAERFRENKSPALLQVFDVFYSEERTMDMVTEPLMVNFKKENLAVPLTLSALITKDSTCYNTWFFENHVKPGKYVFSTQLKLFLRETIKLMIELSKKKIFIKFSANNILLTAKGEFKLFDLRSCNRSLTVSLNDLIHVMKKLVTNLYPYQQAAEVTDFVFKAGHVKPDDTIQTLHRHPAVLQTGEKLKLLLRVHKCLEFDGIEVHESKLLLNWRTKIENHIHLKKVLEHNSKSDPKSKSTATARQYQSMSKHHDCQYSNSKKPDSVSNLVSVIRNIKVHVNTYVNIGEQSSGDYSPLLSHKNGRAKYTDHDVEQTFEYLFPDLATVLHNSVTYPVLDKWGPF